MSTNFPNGVSSYGIPLFGGYGIGIPPGQPGPGERAGNVWFVNNQAVNVNDSNNGLSPAVPLMTISRAIDLASAGDTIFVFAGSYVENLVVDKDYISIIGAQISGYAKPDIVPATALALYNEAAQGLVLRHLRLAAPAVAGDLMRIEGNGFIIEDCVLDGDAAQGAGNALVRLKGNATDDAFTASEGIIRNCYFRGGIFGLLFDTAEPTVGVGETDDVIQNNVFVAQSGSNIATADTGPGTYSIQRGQILGNTFMDKNKTNYIDLTTSNGGAAGDQNGVINGNYFAADAINTTRIAMVGTGFTFTGNYSTVGVVDGSGLD